MEDFNKILENKIRQNKVDYDLYRQNAEISALISGQVFNKWLKEDEKQEGLLKRLKIIEDKTDDQLLEIKDKNRRD